MRTSSRSGVGAGPAAPRRAFITSVGNSDPGNVVAAFNGALLSTHFSGGCECFFENVSCIRRTVAGARSIGRQLLETDIIDDTDLNSGFLDPELAVLISVNFKSTMTVSSAYLYVNTANSIPGTATVDITSGISGSNLTWEYTVGAPNATRYFWIELVDDNANSSITPLGPYTTQDNTPPTVVAANMALGTPPTTSIDLTFNVTDNDAVQTIYVLLSDTQTTNPGAALLKSIGDAYAGGTTSHTYNGLTPATTYYAWIMAKDQVGNETISSSFSPGSLTTNADTTPPTVDSSSLTAGTDPETQVNIALTISDTA